MRSRKFWLASLAYFALTVVIFWPLVRELRTGVPHDVGDPVLNTWILWWNAHAVPFTRSWWNGPAYWPLPDFLALSEHLVGLSVISTPLQWLGAGPQFAYNLVLLLSWPLSAVAGYLLGLQLTGRHDAAFIGGLVFGFNPYRLGQTPHIQVLACWWMPLALVALHRAVQAPDTVRAAPWLAVFAVCWLLQAFSNGYFLFYFSVIVVLWIAWFAARRGGWSRACAIVLVWIVAAASTAPVLLHYKAVHQFWGLTRDPGVIVFFSADVASFVTAPPLARVWPFHPDVRSEQALYPGVVAALLASGGLVAAFLSPGGAPRRLKQVIYVLFAAALVLLGSALATWVIGKWTMHLGPLELSGRRTRQPLLLAAACLLASAALDARVRNALRRRSAWPFYLAATLVGLAMCFGPEGRVAGETLLPISPYAVLMRLPGVENLRVPARFMMVALLPFAASVALAFAWLARRMSPGGAHVASALAVLALVLDSASRPIPMHAVSQAYTLPAAARDTAVVEMPPGEVVDDDLAAMMRGISHRRPVVNGYSGYFPAPYYMLRDALRERDPAVLNGMAAFGPLCIVLDRTRAQTRNLRAVTVGLGASLLDVQGDYSFYRLERRPVPPAVRGRAMAVKAVRALESSHRGPWAVDGRLETYWESVERQKGGEAVTIELAGPGLVSGVALAQGARVGDYPRELVIETSDDGLAWQPAWQGRTAGLAYVAAVTDVGRSRLSISFTARQARVVRLRQTGRSLAAPWSIAEIEILH